MKRAAFAALMIALLPAAAFAEGDKSVTQTRTEDQKKEDAANQKAYEQVIKDTHSGGPASVKIDPWHQVRPADGKR
jgi:hypothetical protein